MINICVEMGKIYNVNLTTIKTSVFFQNAEFRVGLLAKVGIWAGTQCVNTNQHHQMQFCLNLEVFRMFSDFYSARPSLRALYQFGSTVKISDFQEIAHNRKCTSVKQRVKFNHILYLLLFQTKCFQIELFYVCIVILILFIKS